MSKNKTQGLINEEKIVAASYILTLYKEIVALTNTHAKYVNYLLELENKYGDSEKGATDEEKNAILTTVQEIRFYAQNCYIKYIGIAEKVEENKESQEEVKIIYQKILDVKNFMIDRKDSEKLCITFNKVLINEVMQDLLERSQDFIEKIYGEDNIHNGQSS